MSRQTFTWFPEFEAALSQAPNVNVTKFGDGYETRTPEGINNSPEVWSLQFTLAGDNLTNVLNFIKTRNAVETFYWGNPFGVTNVYICRKWKMVRRQGHNVMNFDFEQVFEV